MSFAIRRAVAFALPILILPMGVHAAPKVGTVTSSNGAMVAHNGRVAPASDNMPLFKGDKVMTRSGGSANVELADKSVKLGGSSMVPMDDHEKVVSMDPKSSFKGDGRQASARQLARADWDDRHGRGHDDDDDDGHGRGNHFGHCRGKGHSHHDDDGPGRGHGHGHDHDCPPVSP